MSSSKFFKLLVAVLMIGLSYAVYAHAQTDSAPTAMMQPTTLQSAGVITAPQVAAAGFVGVTALPPGKGKFLLPVYYFKVQETVATSSGWGDVSNVVSVLVVPKFDKSWTYNGGEIQVSDLFGRTKARLTTATDYIVVTGPDRIKVGVLAKSLQAAF